MTEMFPLECFYVLNVNVPGILGDCSTLNKIWASLEEAWP